MWKGTTYSGNCGENKNERSTSNKANEFSCLLTFVPKKTKDVRFYRIRFSKRRHVCDGQHLTLRSVIKLSPKCVGRWCDAVGIKESSHSHFLSERSQFRWILASVFVSMLLSHVKLDGVSDRNERASTSHTFIAFGCWMVHFHRRFCVYFISKPTKSQHVIALSSMVFFFFLFVYLKYAVWQRWRWWFQLYQA